MDYIESSSSSSSLTHSIRPQRCSRIVQTTDVTEPVLPSIDEPNYPYSFDLLAHHGCVNALCFSPTEQGRWLASGGDDQRTILWDMFSDFDKIAPVAIFDGPTSNIFSIEFSANGKWLFTSGVDSKIFLYDLEKSPPRSTSQPNSAQSAVAVLSSHHDSCRRVACHPQESNGLLSAGEDGRIFYHDIRTPQQTSHKPILETRAEYTDVAWNPVDSDLFLASTSHTIKLYDRRKLGCNASDNVHYNVFIYTTNLIKPKPLFKIGHPEISSVAFDPTGQLFGSMMSKWYPTIWTLYDPHPLAVLKSESTPNGDSTAEEGFRDVCTIKHGSFSNNIHLSKPIFAAGSDDFRCYGWELPTISEMRDQRHMVKNFSDWLSQTTLNTCAYGNKEISVPMTISKPSLKLHGHRSIPNALIFHPHLPLICTSGVEKLVKVHLTRQVGWYPHQTSNSRAHLTSTKMRKTMSVEERIPFIFGERHQSERHAIARPEEEDLETLAMFDALLESEKGDEHSLWIGLGPRHESEGNEDGDPDDSFSDYSD